MPMHSNPESSFSQLSNSVIPDLKDDRIALIERAGRIGSWTLQLTSHTLSWSAQLATLLELPYHASEAIFSTHSPLVFYAPESHGLMTAAFDLCLTQSRPFDEEVQAISSNGLRLWVRTLGQPICDSAGTVVGMQGILQDLTEKKRAEQESLSITMRLSTTLASITEAFVTLDMLGTFTYVNEETERLLGCKCDALLGQSIYGQLGVGGSSRLIQEMAAAVNGGVNVEFEEFFPSLGKWLELRVYTFAEGFALYFRDVTASRKSQEQLLLLETSISRLNDVVLITEAGPIDPPGPRIVFVNDAFHRHTGFSREEVLGQPLQMLKGPLTENSELYRIGLALVQSQPIRTELIIYKKNDEPLWMELDIVPVDYLGRGLTHWVSVARDITDRKKAEDEIEHLAFYDVLTKLPNRQLLMKRLEHALVKSANTRKIGSLMFIDLDNFKILNDTLGHSKGDLLLQQVATRLSKCIRKSDTVARLGGDEFVVMLEDLGDSPKEAIETSRTIGEAVLAALSEPYDLFDYQHYGTCSIGITSFSRDRQNIGDLLKQADLAMYQAKAAGRNSVCFFDPQMQAAANASAVMSSELRQALRNQEFVLHYQPQVGLDGMFGVEALVRWLHPERGLIYPGEFIAQAEESGLILPLGQWVMETACAQLANWAGRPETHKLRIAVNVSARQFRHPQFVDSVMHVINESAISADRLKLELTESLLAHDMDVTIAKMGRLKAAGVTLAIDDFGIGYSALSYLKHLPLDQLKIDRSFVKDILKDPNDAAIARTIIGLARSLGLGVVAEGVETVAQRELLSQFGCDCYQGYLFCKALAIDDLEAFMSSV